MLRKIVASVGAATGCDGACELAFAWTPAQKQNLTVCSHIKDNVSSML